MKLEFGLIYAQLGEDSFPEDTDLLPCSDEKCVRFISEGDFCFIDTLEEGGVLCEACGKCVRYARKKEFERQQLVKEGKGENGV